MSLTTPGGCSGSVFYGALKCFQAWASICVGFLTAKRNAKLTTMPHQNDRCSTVVTFSGNGGGALPPPIRLAWLSRCSKVRRQFTSHLVFGFCLLRCLQRRTNSKRQVLLSDLFSSCCATAPPPYFFNLNRKTSDFCRGHMSCRRELPERGEPEDWGREGPQGAVRYAQGCVVWGGTTELFK